MIPLVRDVLDNQIVDVHGCKVGKVDGIILAVRAHRPPRVVALELSQATAWRRIHGRLGDLAEWLRARFGPGSQDPARILFEHVVSTGVDVHVDIDARRSGALLWEGWLEERIIAKIPG